LLAGWLLTQVFAVRIGAEFFKAPQAAYEVGYVFSVGQYLSIPFLCLGIGLVCWALKHSVFDAKRMARSNTFNDRRFRS